jgi:hypothetical protein
LGASPDGALRPSDGVQRHFAAAHNSVQRHFPAASTAALVPAGQTSWAAAAVHAQQRAQANWASGPAAAAAGGPKQFQICVSCDHNHCRSLRLMLLSQGGADVASQHEFLTGASGSAYPSGVERGAAAVAPGRLLGHFPAMAAPTLSSYRMPFPYDAPYPMGYQQLRMGSVPPLRQQHLPPSSQVGYQQPQMGSMSLPPQQQLPPSSQVGYLQPRMGPVPSLPLPSPVMPAASTAGYKKRIWL